MDQEKLRALYSSIVALGYITPNDDGSVIMPDNFRIVGTGLVISEDLIMTNRHVIGQLEQMNVAAENKIWMSYDSFHPSHNIVGTQYYEAYIPPYDMDDTGYSKKNRTDIRSHILDIGFLKIKPDLKNRKFYEIRGIHGEEHRIKFSDLKNIYLGQRIGTVGFLLGNINQHIYLDDSSGLTQEFIKLGPLLHSGIISGFAPNNTNWYEYSVTDDTSQIITDLSVGAGLSGAPVFDWETLDIIGIHFASQKERASQKEHDSQKEYVNQGAIGFTIPLSLERVEHLALLSVANTLKIPLPDGVANLHANLSTELAEKIYRISGLAKIG